ncbi:MAG: tetratricopeptide repeat protein, partial [Isosphaeraceae bacterium]
MDAIEQSKAANLGEAGASSAVGGDLRVRAHRERAVELALAGEFEGSEAEARAALALGPRDVESLIALGVAVWRQGRHGEAEAIYREAGRWHPGDYRIATNLGLALMVGERRDEAAAWFERALELEPSAFHAMMNLGVLVSDRGDFDEASVLLKRALEGLAGGTEVLPSLAMHRIREGKWQEAAELYERALAASPDSPEIHRNLGYCLLALGDFARGWREHEWRLRCTPHPGVRVNRPLWEGDDLRGRSILLHYEQGFGDTLQFVRYARLVKERGGRVVVLCQPPLVRLISRCEGVDLAFDGLGVEPECQVHAPLLSLPHLLGTTPETIPARVPYLSAAPAQVAHWRSVITGLRKSDARDGESRQHRPFLVGVAWQGRPTHRADRWRSFPLERLAPVAAVPGVRLLSLQVDHGVEQLAALGGRFRVDEIPGRLGRDFSETAAIVPELDLVIVPDSALAHLAGGLDAPVWVAHASAADWRWFAGREDSPWYPSMRLFRQERLGDW